MLRILRPPQETLILSRPGCSTTGHHSLRFYVEVMNGNSSYTLLGIDHRCCFLAFCLKERINWGIKNSIWGLDNSKLEENHIVTLTSIAALDVVRRAGRAESCGGGQVLGVTVVDVHTDSSHHRTFTVQFEHS